MRVVSLVPSLTETLLDCGVEVVGRTRFCIHPEEKVRNIPAVGGTKDITWDRVREVSPDLVVLDREENTREMADACPFPWIATHVTSIQTVPDAMSYLAGRVNSPALQDLASDWRKLSMLPPREFPGWSGLPGLLGTVGDIEKHFDRVEYMIWKDPWMAVSRNTFIGSMLSKVGLADMLADHEQPYPELNAQQMPDPNTFYLFSSEPYPFDRYVDELEDLGFTGVVVDGEFFSWFGSRSYRLLKQYMETAV